jgi:hypothetical protein
MIVFKSGRGGKREPGPGKALGAPVKPVAERTVVKGPYRFPPDVVEILGGKRNATRFICEAIRSVADPKPLELAVAIGYCRCGTNHVRINGRGACPNGCANDKTRVTDFGNIEVIG